MIGIAKTGSGKTLAFVLPSLVSAALRTSEWAMKRYATRIAQRCNAQQRAGSPVPAPAAGGTKRHGLPDCSAAAHSG